MTRNFCSVLLAALALAGCVKTVPLAPGPNLTVINATELPPPMRPDRSGPMRAGYLGPLDKVRVTVFGVPDLTLEESVVDSGGKLSVPLVGTIDVNGRTPAEVAQTIQTGLRGRYVRNPQVTVALTDAVSQLVTVDGAVEKPGEYPVTNRTTLMRAIAASGGLSQYAKVDDVVILRQVDTQRMAGLYNIAQIRRGAYGDPEIYPNDVIVVGDSPTRRLFRDIVGVGALAVTQVAIAVLTK